MLREAETQPQNEVFYEKFSTALTDSDTSLPLVDRHKVAFAKAVANSQHNFLYVSDQLNLSVGVGEVDEGEVVLTTKEADFLKNLVTEYHSLSSEPSLEVAVEEVDTVTKPPLSIDYNLFDDEGVNPIDILNTGNNPVEEEVLANERLSFINSLLSQIPQKQAMAIRMRYLMEMDLREIGSHFGITHQSVHNILKRGMAKLNLLSKDIDPKDIFS